jgi:hypothetical protein
MSERTWIRWGGAHAKHEVYERKDGTVVRVICETCKAVVSSTDYAG